MAVPTASPLYVQFVVKLLHDSQHASKKSVSNAGFVCLFSLSPSISEVNNMPGELKWEKIKHNVNIWQLFV